MEETPSEPTGSRPIAARTRRRVLGGALLGWALLAGVIGVRFRTAATDDIYITYTYAAHLAAGQGLVFNPGERVFGVSDPGVAILLAGGHLLTRLPIPLLGTVLTALALLTLAGLVLAETLRAGDVASGVVAGTFLVGSVDLWTAQGAGPLPALALVLLAARWAGEDQRRDGLAGALAGAAVICRPDALIGVLVGGILVLRERRSLPRRLALTTAAVVGLGVAAAVLWFGTPLPSTLAAKRQFAALNPSVFSGPGVFWSGFYGLFARGAGGWAAARLAFSALGAVLVLVRGTLATQRLQRLLVVTGVLLALAYTLLGVPFFAWYTTPAIVALAVGLGAAVGMGVRFLVRSRGAAFRVCAAVVLLLAVCILASATAATWEWWRDQDAGDWRRAAYPTAARWIRDHSSPTDSVVANEVGMLGYWSERRILDLIGLVSPSSLPYLRVGDFLGAFLAHPTTFVVLHTFDRYGGTRFLLVRPWFAAAYVEVARLEFPSLHGSVVIYRRRAGSWVPPPRLPFARAERIVR